MIPLSLPVGRWLGSEGVGGWMRGGAGGRDKVLYMQYTIDGMWYVNS